MTKVLYSAENTSGLFLEDLLALVIEDLKSKSLKVSHLEDVVSKNFDSSNKDIVALLEQAKVLQESACEFSNNHSDLKPFRMQGVDVLATAMTHRDYFKFREEPSPDFGDDFTEEGWYIVTDKGRPNHREWWLPNSIFAEYINT